MSLDLPELSDHLNSFTVIVSCTGSVATIKLPLLITQLLETFDNIKLKVVLTDKAKHFCPKTDLKNLPVDVYTDYEWDSWTTPDGNASLHDELAKKANMLLIAPLDANTLAKIANVRIPLCLCSLLILCALDSTKL